MAIVKCPECGKDISDSAPVCPNCGYSFMFAPPTKAQAKTNLFLLLGGIVFGIITKRWFIYVVAICGILQLLYAIVTVFLALLFGSRSVRLVLKFLVFDLGFFIGTLIGVFL